MTAPTPDQMRALADEARQYADAYKSRGEMLGSDRYQRMSAALNTGAEELDRLRDVIDDAPHARECYSGGAPATECDCWKADAL